MNIFHSFKPFSRTSIEKNIHLINSCLELHSKIVNKNDFIYLNNDLDM